MPWHHCVIVLHREQEDQPTQTDVTRTDAASNDLQQQQLQQQAAGQTGSQQQEQAATEQQQQQQQGATDPAAALSAIPKPINEQADEEQQQGAASMGSLEGLTEQQLADKTHEHAMAAMMMGAGPPAWGGRFDNRWPLQSISS